MRHWPFILLLALIASGTVMACMRVEEAWMAFAAAVFLVVCECT